MRYVRQRAYIAGTILQPFEVMRKANLSLTKVRACAPALDLDQACPGAGGSCMSDYRMRRVHMFFNASRVLIIAAAAFAVTGTASAQRLIALTCRCKRRSLPPTQIAPRACGCRVHLCLPAGFVRSQRHEQPARGIGPVRPLNPPNSGGASSGARRASEFGNLPAPL